MSPIDFIGIGPARAGTTWLYTNLSRHPEITMAKWDKKTHFFDLYYDKGITWYENFFTDTRPGCKKGELTETYIFHDEVPERIKTHYPEIKIFSCLRNPVDRAFSAYMHLVRDGVVTESIEQAMVKFQKILITDNMYFDRLKPYFDTFDKTQLHITLFEDISINPEGFLKDIYTFLGVSNDFLPQDYDVKHNVTEHPRFPLLNKLMLLTHMALRDRDLYKYLLPLKNTKWVQRLRFKEKTANERGLTPEIKADLHGIFDPQVRKLSELINKDLSTWLAE